MTAWELVEYFGDGHRLRSGFEAGSGDGDRVRRGIELADGVIPFGAGFRDAFRAGGDIGYLDCGLGNHGAAGVGNDTRNRPEVSLGVGGALPASDALGGVGEEPVGHGLEFDFWQVAGSRTVVLAKAREFVQFGRRYGYDPDDLIDFIRQISP